MFKNLSNKNKGKLTFGLCVIPAVLLVILEMYIPFVMTFYYSFFKWNGISSHPKFVGVQNFVKIFTTDESFSTALIFTLKYTVLFVVIVNVLAILLAVFLDKKFRLANAIRGIFFVPYIMSLVVVGFVWKFIFSQGFANLYQFSKLGVFNLGWLSSPTLAFFSIVFVSVWQAVGFYMVIYIAGLQSVPTDLLEAATVDGAGPIKRFFKITLPMLMPSITVCLFLALTNAFKLYDVIVSLTAAGPAGSTASITYDIYREEFQNSNYGYGSAKGLILFIMVGVITIIQVTLSKKKEVEV